MKAKETRNDPIDDDEGAACLRALAACLEDELRARRPDLHWDVFPDLPGFLLIRASRLGECSMQIIADYIVCGSWLDHFAGDPRAYLAGKIGDALDQFVAEREREQGRGPKCGS